MAIPVRAWAVGAIALTLAGCEGGEFPALFQNQPSAAEDAGIEVTTADQVGAIERDVEAPEVFAANEEALWDGRPSLGGVWVAYPDVPDPERVIIRNSDNGEFVIGALFRRERDNPGPKIQVSSDAAEALGMLAGQPTNLSVVALRREEIPMAGPAPVDIEDTVPLGATGPIEAEPLDATTADADSEVDAIAAAAAAISAAESNQPAATPAPAPAPAPAPIPASAPTSTLEKPFIQIGIFSVEDNAVNTAVSVRNVGVLPTVLEQESSGKKFWRVIVGPATSESERAILLDKIEGLGFEDAYFVTN